MTTETTIRPGSESDGYANPDDYVDRMGRYFSSKYVAANKPWERGITFEEWLARRQFGEVIGMKRFFDNVEDLKKAIDAAETLDLDYVVTRKTAIDAGMFGVKQFGTSWTFEVIEEGDGNEP